MRLLEPAEVREEFKMFSRSDSFRWKKWKMFITVFSVFPIRVVLLVVGLVVGMIGYWVITWMGHGRLRRVS